jgi:serine/threonine protein kinase
MPKKPTSMDFGPTTQQFEPAPMNDALPAGTRLGGYQILEVLGRGGFGIVYLALDSSLQRQVAIKEYLPAELSMRCDDGQVWVRPGADAGAYAAGMTAFLSEAKMLARFDHPSLARVHSFWEENRSAYMVMPYYEGRTLAALLADMPRPPDEAWLRSLLIPLLSALSTLHNAQCLHLDISPDNIIVLPDGRPVLLDFGVASRLATDKTMPLTALLNPAYAPIEQYSESPTLPQGPWSDLYALASVLHFAIVGAPPARATVRAMDDPQRPLAEIVAERALLFPGLSYSASFLAAIDKALAVKPRERPRSAAEFQLLLDHLAAREAAPPVPPPSFEPPAPPHRSMPAPTAESWLAAEPRDIPPPRTRSRAPLWIASVAALGLAAVGGWAWLQRQPSLATITVADLPPTVVASIPKPAEAASSAAPASAPQVSSAPSPEAVNVAPSAMAAASAQAPAASSAVRSPAPPPTASSVVDTAAAMAPTPPTAPPSAAAPAPAARTAKAAPKANASRDKPAAKPTKPVATAPALPPEPTTPRAACGTRSNFALVYCMQQQCKRWKFNTHPQCLELERRGEL